MGVILNRTALAEHMGVSTVAIDNWRKEGMPIVTRGSRGVEWSFDLAAVIKWWGDRKVAQAGGDAPSDLAEIEKRTATAKMQQAELKAAQARREVAPIRQFERAQAAAFAEIRTRIMNVPQRVVIQLLGETDESVFKQKLRAELTLALKAAAEAQLTLGDEEEQDDD